MLPSAEVVKGKFALRKLIPFFLKKRQEVMGDGDFEFTLNELNDYLRQNRTDAFRFDELKTAMENLKDFCVRDENGMIIYPNTTVLDCKIQSETDEKITIMKSSTSGLNNILTFIDKSIYVKERPKEYKNKSFFDITQDHKLQFGDKIYERSLGNKEYAIFNALRKKFNKECKYNDLFEKVNALNRASGENLRNRYRTAQEKKTLINNGITELRTKLQEISGNPACIKTLEGRLSKYKLIY